MPKVNFTGANIQTFKIPAKGQIDYTDKTHRGLGIPRQPGR
jgi:hypothetical protein